MNEKVKHIDTKECIKKCNSIRELCDFFGNFDCALIDGNGVDSMVFVRNIITDYNAINVFYKFGLVDNYEYKSPDFCGLREKILELYLQSKKMSKQPRNAKNWQLKHYKIAEAIALQSKDSKKIGCVIVNESDHILATGYNGFPRGFNDDIPERHEKPMKYNYTVHAEANTIASAAYNGSSLKGSTLYVNWFPCSNCALLIAQAGIKEVVCTKPDFDHERWGESFRLAYEILNECEIKLTYID